MNKHDQALSNIKILSKRLKMSFKDNELQVITDEKTHENDLELLKVSVGNLGGIQVQELIKFFNT